MTEIQQVPATMQLTLRAIDQLRDLIVSNELLPGEKIKQVALAKRVGVSRSPLREALRTLESEGLISYEVNRGYVVSRLDRDDLSQIYSMRALLEMELLRSIGPASPDVITTMKKHNNDLLAAIADENISEMLRANRLFHFCIFDLSPLDLFRREVLRLWQLSEGYRATYLWMPETRKRIIDEHEAIVKAVEIHDIPNIVHLCSEHRMASADVVVRLLGRRGSSISPRREAE